MMTGTWRCGQVRGRSLNGAREPPRRADLSIRELRHSPGSWLQNQYAVRRCCTRHNADVRRSELRKWGTRKQCVEGAAAVASIRHQPASGPSTMADDGVDRRVVGKLVCNSVAAVISTPFRRSCKPTTKLPCVTVRVMAHRSWSCSSSSGAPREASLSLRR
jgi:hypothetical protein